MALESEFDFMPTNTIIERLQVLKMLVGITDDIKEKKNLNGEIKYLENLVLEKEFNNER